MLVLAKKSDQPYLGVFSVPVLGYQLGPFFQPQILSSKFCIVLNQNSTFSIMPLVLSLARGLFAFFFAPSAQVGDIFGGGCLIWGILVLLLTQGGIPQPRASGCARPAPAQGIQYCELQRQPPGLAGCGGRQRQPRRRGCDGGVAFAKRADSAGGGQSPFWRKMANG